MLGVVFLAILFLEIGSRISKCKDLPYEVLYSCKEENRPEQKKDVRLLLNELKDKRSNNQKISKQEYRKAADIFITEVDPSRLDDYFNGIACRRYGYGFVRNNMQGAAKDFVKRHEFEHLLQTGMEKNIEFSANFVAVKEYPLGFISTIFSTMRHRARYFDSWTCYLSNSWKTFKSYLLPSVSEKN